MARYTDSVCRLCRREGLKLFLKGDRCFSDRCAFDRRGYPPGVHGQQRSKFSEYGIQLREKQKVRRIYGIMERQFRTYFHEAERRKGVTGETLLFILESRLDNMVFRMGFARTRSEARQLVRHGHFRVNGKKVNIPSYPCKAGDLIELRERSHQIAKIAESLGTVARRGLPTWIEIEASNFKGTVKSLPKREDLTMPIQEQLIVELYSK